MRRKAVLCLRSFVLNVTELAPSIQSHVCDVLGDKDPGVVWAVIEIYREFAKVLCCLN